jgi:hypothetical protein
LDTLHIAGKAISVQYRKTLNASVRDSWIRTTESLKLDRDGRELWRLVKVMNDEDCKSQETAIHVYGKKITGKNAANTFLDIFAEVSQLNMSPERKHEVLTEIEEHKGTATALKVNMACGLTMKELEAAIHSLKLRKSPGKDGITNDMLKRLRPVATTKLLKIMNISWKREIVPQVWKEAKMVPFLKKDKDRLDPNSYSPINLLSCTCKLMERIINTRRIWYLEKKTYCYLNKQGSGNTFPQRTRWPILHRKSRMRSRREKHYDSLDRYGEYI